MSRAARAALVLGALVAGCGDLRSPAGAVRALAEAAEEGDRAAVYALLGPDTRAALAADAARASEQAGRRALRPFDLLAAGWSPPRWRMTDLQVEARDGERARVAVLGPGGERETVECRRVDGEWRVELPLGGR